MVISENEKLIPDQGR